MRKVIGIHACREALRVSANNIRELYIKKGFEKNPQLKKIWEQASRIKHIKSKEVPEKILDSWGSGHQGVGIFLQKKLGLDLERVAQKSQSVLLALDGIQDPQNLGAIIRTSWLLGVDGIFLPNVKAAKLTPTVAKIASGGAEHVPLSEESNLASVIAPLKDKGYWVYGLSEKSNQTLFDAKLPEKVVFAVGAEDLGLKSQTRKVCDELISIPQISSDGASLNASVSVAIALAEMRRQHPYL